ncbi:hypothetical protein C8J57DRAFT_1241863 [Mycena rebaudengoi]|nr:hypothetical protein C8J57DRAFT_1241863 [Mycena rebaudengoi]
MSDETQGKSKNPNWGGARQGAGRPKKTLKRTFTQLQNADSDSQPAPVPSGSGSATHSSFEPATGRSNVIQRTAKKLAIPSHRTELENTNSIVQLNKDLAAAAAFEDEPQDLSERIFEESLGDTEAENDDSANAEWAQTETEEAEVQALSANHQWLKANLAKIIKETDGPGKPRPNCYKNGELWIRPIDPVFALEQAGTSGLTPADLYLLPIFVWLPSCLPGHPEAFKCECGMKLIRHGYNENPIARRVSTLNGQDYFLLTNRFLCPLRRENDRGCGHSYQGSDPWILGQLPEFVQKAFPACLSPRGALDNDELDVMKATFSGRFGADPFSKMVRELKVLHHDRLETMYYCAASHHGFRGPEQVPRFSMFDDPQGYAGHAPSTRYFKSMFTAWFSAHRILMDRVMSSESATIIKADHTYKTIDHQSCLPGGEPINSDEVVRAYAFTLTQSFPPLREVYERMQAELQRHGHPPTRLLYTDNPRSERNFHESVNSSLCKNVQHIVLDPFRDLPPFKTSDMPTVYFSSQALIDSACDEILEALASSPLTEPIVISLSVKCAGDTPAIIQLCCLEKISIFRVLHIKSEAHIPPCLRALLTNTRIVKIGHQIRQSMRSISTAWSIPSLAAADSSSVIDLAHIAKIKGAVSDATSSLPILAGTVLKKSTPDLVELSTLDWSGETQEEQVKKLAQEVDCVSQIYKHLMKMDSIGLPLQPAQICAGQLVMLVIGKVPLAEDHGGHAIVQIRTLRSRALIAPHPSDNDTSLGTPAPMNPPTELTSRSSQSLLPLDTLPSQASSNDGAGSDNDSEASSPEDMVLTRLSTKPCNIYRYIQLRQRTPVPVIPVHNFAEYKFFKSNVDTFRINMPAGRVKRSPEQIWKATDYIKFAVFWNQAVMSQSPQILEAHLRLYFKLPEQLLRHHKKTLQWKSSRATLYMGPNAELLKPIQEILGDANRLAIVLPAIPLEPEQVDFLNDNTVGVDLESFNPMAIRRCVAEELRSDAYVNPSPSSNFDTQSQNSVPTTPLLTLDVSPSIELTSHAPEQTIFRFQGGSNPSLTIERPSKKPRLDNSEGSGKKRRGRRCARCATAGCPRATECKGKGGRNHCSCTSNEHEIGDKRFYG